MRISEILWKAANEHLMPYGDSDTTRNDSPYSCDAVFIVGDDYGGAEGLLWEMGCPGGLFAFAEFEEGSIGLSSGRERATEDSQGARYAWLMFASMYAEELEAAGKL